MKVVPVEDNQDIDLISLSKDRLGAEAHLTRRFTTSDLGPIRLDLHGVETVPRPGLSHHFSRGDDTVTTGTEHRQNQITGRHF